MMTKVRVRVKDVRDINFAVDTRLAHWSPKMEELCGKEIEVHECISEPNWFHGDSKTWHKTWVEEIQ